MNESSAIDRGLNPIQHRLLSKLISRKLGGTASPEIGRVPAGTRVPLLASQARIWFVDRAYPGSTEYNSFVTLLFADAPDNERVEAAVEALMARHDALRLRIVEVGQEAMQEECCELGPPLAFFDLSEKPAEAAEREALAIGSASAALRFQLDRPPLFRVSFIRMPEGKALLVLVFHHIIVDGWSANILLEDLTALLSGNSDELTPAVRFIDYVDWQRDRVSEVVLGGQLAYWRQQLGGDLPVLDVPKDRPRPAIPSRRGATVPCAIPLGVIQALKSLAETERTTMFVVLLAAYKTLLLRLSGQTDLIVGTPFAGREHSIIEGTVGCFVNTVALRTQLDRSDGFRDIVRRVRATVLEAQDNQTVPFDSVVSSLRVPRETQYNPVFQTLFVLQNTPRSGLSYPGAEIGDLALDSAAAKFDLTVSMTETAQGVSGFFEYSLDLFDRETVERYAALYVRLSTAVAAELDAPVGLIGLVSDQERQRILYGLNPHSRPQHPYTTMAQPFEEQVARTPDATALVGDEGSMSYSSLNEQANRLAHYLRANGIGRGSFVGICMERSFSLIVALYAVAKSGAAYVPLDPELPDARLAFMIADTTASMVIVDAITEKRIPSQPWKVVSMDADAAQWSDLPSSNIHCAGPAHHIVHVLYTSGSTGRPKGVAYPVEAAIAEIFWLQRSYPFQPGDANIFKTSYGFDVSIWEIFWTLYFGARLAICRPGGHKDPHYLAEVIDKYGVTWMFMIPAMLQLFLDERPPGSCKSLRWVLCGGEAVTPRLRDAFYARLGAKLVQGYGPTEAGCVTDMIIPPDPGCPTVPLGRPAANYRLYVLDENLDVVPIKVLGEAYLAGEVGIAQCYHGRPALTAQAFLPDPFGAPGGRMYQTGDICCYRNDGVLEHHGRSGRQVKIRGMRVELSEIETVLCEHETVDNCVVLAVSNESTQLLVAFVIVRLGQTFDPDELARHARLMLPRFMVPSSILPVEAIPTTVNGKIDRQALIEHWHRTGTTSRVDVAPSGEVETRMKRIFERVTGRESVSVVDSFFDLGGHSLLIFKLIAECEREFHFRPSAADVFSSPSVRELCTRIASQDRGCRKNLVPLGVQPGKPMVVFVHAASGSILPFVELARHIGPDYSTFGLESPEQEDLPHQQWTIEGLAERYVGAVDEVRDLSPVVLVGWSMGGCVCIEMVRRWQQQGTEVAALLMLDSWLPPATLSSPDQRADTRRLIEAIDVLEFEGVAPSEPAATTDALVRLRRALELNRHAFIHYEPARLDAEIDFLRATDPISTEENDFPAVYAAPDRGWSRHVRSVAVHEIPGNHFTLMSGDNARTLAEAIRNIAEQRLWFATV